MLPFGHRITRINSWYNLMLINPTISNPDTNKTIVMILIRIKPRPVNVFNPRFIMFQKEIMKHYDGLVKMIEIQRKLLPRSSLCLHVNFGSHLDEFRSHRDTSLQIKHIIEAISERKPIEMIFPTYLQTCPFSSMILASLPTLLNQSNNLPSIYCPHLEEELQGLLPLFPCTLPDLFSSSDCRNFIER